MTIGAGPEKILSARIKSKPCFSMLTAFLSSSHSKRIDRVCNYTVATLEGKVNLNPARDQPGDTLNEGEIHRRVDSNGGPLRDDFPFPVPSQCEMDLFELLSHNA